MHTVKEGGKRKVNAVNYVLQDLAIDFAEFRILFLPRRQIGLLVIASDRDLGGVVLELPVVDETVVNEAAGFQSFFQFVGLGFRGI